MQMFGKTGLSWLLIALITSATAYDTDLLSASEDHVQVPDHKEKHNRTNSADLEIKYTDNDASDKDLN